MSTETIAVFGGSGRTGMYFVPLALQQGYKVRALVRTPSKMSHLLQEHENNLTLIKGDFFNTQAIHETVKGAKYVVSMAGGPDNNKTYPDMLMTNFCKKVWPILDAELSVKTFLYQSSCLPCKPDGTNPLILKLARPIEGFLLGIRKGVNDNECAAKFMDANRKDSFKTIVIRPGRLLDIPSSGDRTLIASQRPQIRALAYKDLASFNLQAMKDTSLEGQYPFVVYGSKTNK